MLDGSSPKPHTVGMSKKPKRPRDPNQLAKFVLDVVTGEQESPQMHNHGKNPDAVALGKLGALKGGTARTRKRFNAGISKVDRTGE
jgi:hypothetical protein